MRRTSGCRPGDAGVEGGLFAGFVDDLIDGLGLFFDDLLDVRRMDAAIHRQAAEGAAGDLAPHRVEAGDGHGFGRIVHDHVHAGGLLEGLDVAPVAAHDAALHLFVGQHHHGGGHFGHMLGGHALDGIGDQLAGALLAFLAGLGLDLAIDAGHIGARFLFDCRHQFLLGVLRGELGDLLQLRHLVFVELVDVVGALVHRALALVEVLFALLELIGAAVELGAALIEPLRFLAELDAALLDLGFGGLHDLGGAVARLASRSGGPVRWRSSECYRLCPARPLSRRSR